MDNLFGQTPWEVQQGMNQQINQSADAYAKLDPFQRAAAGMHRAGGMLAGPVAGMLGMENPAIAQAKRTEQIMGAQGTDLSSSEGLLKKAEQFRQAGDLRTATALAMKGQEMRRQEAAAALAGRKQDFQEQQMYDLKLQELAQRGEIAKQRSEDSRLAAADRAAAAREANMIRFEIAKMGAAAKTGAAEVKKSETAQKKEEGRGTVDSMVTSLLDYYDQLSKSGGITDPSKGAISNIGAGVASSSAGQAMGKLLGTKDQSIRNSIEQQRPLLLQAIKEATGMSAKQMDSNVELKMYLAAATDPKLDIQANIDALNNLSKLYGLGEAVRPTGREAAGKIGAPAGNRTFKVIRD